MVKLFGPKKEKLSVGAKQEMLRRGERPDRRDWDYEETQFVDSVRRLFPDRFTDVELLQINSNFRIAFYHDLEGEKAELDRGFSPTPVTIDSVPNSRSYNEKIARHQAKEKKQQKEVRAREVSAAQQALKNAEKKKAIAEEKRIAGLKKEQPIYIVPQRIYLSPTDSLIHDPTARKKRGKENLKVILDWLRQEPYSTVEIMSLVLRMSLPGTRKILNKAVKEGWLVRDEVPWVGVSGKLHLFGVSSKGLYHLISPGDIQPGGQSDFVRGKTRPNSGEHILNIQLTRLFLQRINNPNSEPRRYTSDRKMKEYKKQGYSWDKFPDALIENSAYRHASRRDRALTVAVEVEQHSKGSKAYWTLIRKHLRNMNMCIEDADFSDRYDLVIYFLPSHSEVDTYRILFHKLIEEHATDEEKVDSQKRRFLFDTYVDLPERIRVL